MSEKRKLISVNERTYLELKQLGLAGDSFNHVISRLLKSRTTTASAGTRQKTGDEIS
jgi:predicted CopG family antitoxin